jgi:hypothetical protein
MEADTFVALPTVGIAIPRSNIHMVKTEFTLRRVNKLVLPESSMDPMEVKTSIVVEADICVVYLDPRDFMASAPAAKLEATDSDGEEETSEDSDDGIADNEDDDSASEYDDSGDEAMGIPRTASLKTFKEVLTETQVTLDAFEDYAAIRAGKSKWDAWAQAYIRHLRDEESYAQIRSRSAQATDVADGGVDLAVEEREDLVHSKENMEKQSIRVARMHKKIEDTSTVETGLSMEQLISFMEVAGHDDSDFKKQLAKGLKDAVATVNS